MGLLGNFAKGFLIMTVAFWIFAIIELTYMKQLFLATLLFIGLLISLSMIVYEYLKNRKTQLTDKTCKKSEINMFKPLIKL